MLSRPGFSKHLLNSFKDSIAFEVSKEKFTIEYNNFRDFKI